MYDTVRDALVPIVIEQSNRGERSFDIFSRLLRDDQRGHVVLNLAGRRGDGGHGDL